MTPIPFNNFELTCLRGSFLLSRFHTYQSKYLSALAFLDVGYFAPGVDVNMTYVETYNNISQAEVGYPALGYWYYYDQPDGHVLMDENVSASSRPSFHTS